MFFSNCAQISNRSTNRSSNLMFKSVEFTYRALADVLIAQGAFWPKPSRFWRCSKWTSFFGFVRRDADEIKNLTSRLEPNSTERKALERYLEAAEQVTALGAETIKLEDRKNGSEQILLSRRSLTNSIKN
ncbi:MAG: hypothetical protein WKF73_16625 [Nocardioidaceae bacterium]